MTQQEQALADDKMRAEIAKLIEDANKVRAETLEINQNMKYRFWVMAAAYVSAMAVLLKYL